MNMKKKGVYFILGFILLVVSIFTINAVVDKDKAWHNSSEILVTIEGYTMTLEEAITNNVFIDGAIESYTSEIPNPGHSAEEVWISVDGDEKTLQTAIDELSTSDSLCRAGELLCKPICNFVGTFKECWYDPCAKECIGGLCEGNKAICEEIGFPEEGWYSSRKGELILLGNCAYESSDPSKVDKSQFANEIEVSSGISLQDSIDSGDFCCVPDCVDKPFQPDGCGGICECNWLVSKPSTVFEFEANHGSCNSLQKIDATHYLNTYLGADYDGYAVVLEVNPTDWSISKPSTAFEFDTSRGSWNSLQKIDATHYLNTYQGADYDGYAVVLEVNPTDWSISKPSTAFEFDTYYGIWNSLQKIDATHYLNTYQGNGEDGYAVVLEVNPTDWSISKPSTVFEFDVYNGLYNSLQKIDATHYLNTYQGNGEDGYAVVLEVNPTDWSISKPSTVFEFDANYGDYNALQKIDATHYLNIYSPFGGHAVVLEVNPTDWSISKPSTVFEFDANYGDYNALQKIDATHYLNIYSPFGGHAVVLEVNPTDWSISKPSTVFESDVMIYNSLQQIDITHYLNTYYGGKGYAVVLEIT